MSKRDFKAVNWLTNKNAQPFLQKGVENFCQRGSFSSNNLVQEPIFKEKLESENISNFFPPNFLVSGWKGESLISKPALNIKKVLYELLPEARNLLKHSYGLNKSLKLAIYNEFIDYSHSESINCPLLDNFTTFWEHLLSDKSPYQNELENFLNIFSFKAITTYLFKIKFIIHLCKAISITPTERNLLNPNSFLEKIFKKGSSTELLCESLQPNPYSWYRPSSLYKNKISTLANAFDSISITELMKITTYRSESKKLKFHDKNYSHSLSHKSFGLFINTLLIFLPYWLQNRQYPNNNPTSGIPTVLNCKFLGNHLKSLTLSHWLAQETNLKEKRNLWSELLCPNFFDNEYSNGRFVKICHEMQFLTFLVQVSSDQNYDTVSLICNVMKEKYSQSELEQNNQITLFPQYSIKSDLLYDRIVINLSNLPKKNSHHFLLNQLYAQTKSLKANSYLFVATNQQLFLPSQSKKIEQLLGTYKLETLINMENLKGKGEIPSYLYIFSPRAKEGPETWSFKSTEISSLLSNNSSSNKKDSCLTFRLSGELKQFHHFTHFVKALEEFLTENRLTPIYQKEIEEKLLFEFHQDAIVNGKLLLSTSQDPNKITHPSFFKNLTKSCTHLEDFFGIEAIHNYSNPQDKTNTLTTNLLGISYEEQNKYPLVLIINARVPENIHLELIHSDSYKAKFEKYGVVDYHYFGLNPKRKDININLFREFFETEIGHQLIQLSLSGGTKLKSKLKSMLVPKFFSVTQRIPEQYEHNLPIFKIPPEEFLKIHPTELKDSFITTNKTINSLSSRYPWHICGLLSFLKNNIEKNIQDIDLSATNVNDFDNYNNPIILEPLLKAKSYPIYPHNSEIFAEFNINDPKEIHLPLTNTILKKEGENYMLELYSGEQQIISIYSERSILSFIKYILNSSAQNVPISTILQNLQVPKIEDLSSILTNFIEIKECFEFINDGVNALIKQIFIQQISSQT